MQLMEHHIEVDADVAAAYQVCFDVERWPRIFPPCQAARVLEQDGQSQLIEVTALANGQSLHWRSHREFFPEAHVITFRQVQPSPLLKWMEGVWRFFPLRQGTLVVLEHRFDIKERITDDHGVQGVTTPLQALEFMKRSVDTNSQRELAALKEYLEGGATRSAPSEWRRRFEEQLVIAARPEAVFELLKRADRWPGLLPHCHAVEMVYDDDHHQEFVMTVSTQAGVERIRTVRQCTAASRVSYFQSEPPPLIRIHTGEWLLEPTSGGVRVTSRHEVELKPDKVKQLWGDVSPDEAMGRVEQAINANSRGTLQALQQRLAV
ncbi:SRPBCC family protein [Corallococcus sp. BB11-1]|uniref:aromatase/cyclase n=1 Tax=Corallococcus sp. BB11-1 TaxID=2996783 RepID=UPI00226F81BE|nr:SRPBCC family protein [Corallococcus sp. BB11-1]MCY1035377.1 SRPBCC family protein [Corallococcus sp. BB11-1]